MKRKTINNAVIVSDLHMICRLGLYPAGYKLRLDDGGYYMPSEAQEVVWSWWRDFWRNWVPRVTRGEPYAVVLNGDMIDGGDHHRNATHISANEADQERLARHVLEPVAAGAARLYCVRGTEAHAGRSGVNEERLAEWLGAVPNEQGQHARWRLRLRVGHALVDIAHHIGATGSLAYETSAIQKELQEAYTEAARWGEEPPDIIVRSHRHRYAETRIRIAKPLHGRKAQGFATSCTTPGWQLKTPLAHRIAGARQARPQFGGVVVRCGDEEAYTRAYVQSVEGVPIEEA